MKQTQYGRYTYNSPSLIRRYTHRLRLNRSIKSLGLRKIDSILDYGAGDGYMAKLLCKLGFTNICCFEPLGEQYSQMLYLLSEHPEIQKTNNVSEIIKHKYDKIFCLEVLEHLPEKQLITSIQTIYKLLNKDGKALITVPCESGINGFVKNCIKKTIDKNENYSYTDLWNIAHNKKAISRIAKHHDTHPYIYEHLGFSNIQLEQYLNSNNFEIENKFYFPLKYLNFFSSQIFYIISKRE